MSTRTRCPWAGSDPLYIEYHDVEWGVPVHDDRKLFEMLLLEGAQAGLSWITILRKREAYRAAFARFDPLAVARFSSRDRARLLKDAGIVRNRAKVEAAIGNAKAFLEVQETFGSFDAYLWRFVDGTPVRHAFRAPGDVPPSDPVAETISKDLKKRAFKFVGPTIVYAFMQAVGVVNDHLVTCFRYREMRR